MNRSSLVSAASWFAFLLSVTVLGCSSGTTQGTAPNGATPGTGTPGADPNSSAACAADHPLHCAEVLRCEAACADGDNACVTACEQHIATGSKPIFDAANTCVMNSNCMTADCAVAKCKDTLDACTADDLPACVPAAPAPGPGTQPDAGPTTTETCLPACLADLKTKCPPLVGACTVQTTPGVVANYCYANGTKMRVPLGGAPSSFVGCPARTYDTQFGGSSVTFDDASGNPVATVTPAGGTKFTVTCGGQSYDVDSSSAACVNDPHIVGVLQNASTSQCVEGTCAVAF